jgi:hypothetical protein
MKNDMWLDEMHSFNENGRWWRWIVIELNNWVFLKKHMWNIIVNCEWFTIRYNESFRILAYKKNPQIKKIISTWFQGLQILDFKYFQENFSEYKYP